MSLGTELAPIPLGPQGDCWGRGTNIASDVFFSGLDVTSRLSRAELGYARPPRLPDAHQRRADDVNWFHLWLQRSLSSQNLREIVRGSPTVASTGMSFIYSLLISAL